VQKPLTYTLFIQIAFLFALISTASALTSCREQTPSSDLEAARWFNDKAPWIATYKELDYLDKLSSFEDRKQFIRNFWLRRDPDPDTDENEFLVEYCNRLDFAAKFSSGLPGFKTDRGRIYILWGPPDNKTDGRGEFEGVSNVLFEKWQYDHIESLGTNISISFVDPIESNEYRMTLQDRSKFEGVFDCYNQGLLPTQYPQENVSCFE
jgi:GWxTD domain-containing protein